jgi:phosphoribosylformimino-5-aminoimidazole carboxamide ribotide isomerase
MRFRPCIDLHHGKVKQIVGSTLRDDSEPYTNFESVLPPSHYAARYREDNLTGGHVVMLGKGNENAAIEALQAFPGGLQAGGGMTPENARRYLDAGASHVIVTSYVFRDGAIHWANLEKMTKCVGSERLVLDLSCKRDDEDYVVVTDRWQHLTDVILSPDLFGKLADFCDEYLIHAAHVEGMRSGIDERLVAFLSTCTVKPLTYAGGVRSFSDLELIRNTGGGAVDVTIGSALDLFGGNLPYREVVEWFAAAHEGDF